MAADRQEATAVEVIRWEDFEHVFARGHKQGEHVAIVGQTGSGKSILGLGLCKIIARRRAKDGRPARVVVFATKPRDDTVTALGWPVVKKWPPAFGEEHCVVWPKSSDPELMPQRQRAVFRPLMRTIFHEGGQTVYIDEASYFEDPLPDGLALAPTINQYWGSARSLKISLIAGTQRPRHVSRSMWSEPSWVFIFPPDDEDDLQRVAQLSGARRQVLEIVDSLGGHEFLCIHRPRGGPKKLYVSKVGT